MSPMNVTLDPVPEGQPTFLNMPRCTDLDSLDADIAFIAVPFGVHYDFAASRETASAAAPAIREQSLHLANYLTHYDWDFGGDILAGRDIRIVDCGAVHMEPGEYQANNAATTAAIRAILDRGAIPFVVGGSHAISIPVMRAYEGLDPMYVVQIDAHLDFRDEVNGIRDGYSSPMRRAVESDWVSGAAQIGIRSIGSARKQEFDDARAYGNLIVGAEELHDVGTDRVLERIPQSDRYYITLDCDGLDPIIAPGVGMPAFGGLTYYEATNLLRGVAAKGKVVGFDFPVVSPPFDVSDMTAQLATRLILNMIGALAHTGQIGTRARGRDEAR